MIDGEKAYTLGLTLATLATLAAVPPMIGFGATVQAVLTLSLAVGLGTVAWISTSKDRGLARAGAWILVATGVLRAIEWLSWGAPSFSQVSGWYDPLISTGLVLAGGAAVASAHGVGGSTAGSAGFVAAALGYVGWLSFTITVGAPEWFASNLLFIVGFGFAAWGTRALGETRESPPP